MEPNVDTLQELKNFQTYWRTRNLEDPTKLEEILEHLVTMTISQQEGIIMLKEYVEKQKELEKEKEADDYHKYQMGLSDFT
jgi:hypothetical protein